MPKTPEARVFENVFRYPSSKLTAAKKNKRKFAMKTGVVIDLNKKLQIQVSEKKKKEEEAHHKKM